VGRKFLGVCTTAHRAPLVCAVGCHFQSAWRGGGGGTKTDQETRRGGAKERFGAWRSILDNGLSTRPTAKVATDAKVKDAKVFGADGAAGRKFPLVVVALAETTNGTNDTNPGRIGFV
jgi:hypothetical protein